LACHYRMGRNLEGRRSIAALMFFNGTPAGQGG
jgi:hypothetical protein